MRRSLLLFAPLFSCAALASAFAADVSGVSPFGASYTKIFQQPFFASASLSIRRADWSRKLSLTFYYRDPTRSMVRVGGSEREMGTIALRRDGRVYFYFPRAELLVGLASGMGAFPLFGSDFSTDDLLAFGDVAARFAARSEGAETLSGVPALRYRLAPRDAKNSPYAAILLWVTRDGQTPLRQEFLSPDGKIAREILMESDGRLPFPNRWKARTLGERGGESELAFHFFQRNAPLRDDLFTVEGLRQWR